VVVTTKQAVAAAVGMLLQLERWHIEVAEAMRASIRYTVTSVVNRVNSSTAAVLTSKRSGANTFKQSSLMTISGVVTMTTGLHSELALQLVVLLLPLLLLLPAAFLALLLFEAFLSAANFISYSTIAALSSELPC
jgi:hypothetical protein